MLQLSHGLATCHQHGIAHRDGMCCMHIIWLPSSSELSHLCGVHAVKPENILLRILVKPPPQHAIPTADVKEAFKDLMGALECAPTVQIAVELEQRAQLRAVLFNAAAALASRTHAAAASVVTGSSSTDAQRGASSSRQMTDTAYAALCDFGCSLVSDPSRQPPRAFSGRGSWQYSAPEVVFAYTLSDKVRLYTTARALHFSTMPIHLASRAQTAEGVLPTSSHFSGSYAAQGEKIRAIGFDPRASDVWSLGVTIFALVTNRAPFARASPDNAVYRAFVRCTAPHTVGDFLHAPWNRQWSDDAREAQPLRWRWSSSISPALRHLLRRCMAVRPSEWYSMQQVMQHPWFNDPWWQPGPSRTSATSVPPDSPCAAPSPAAAQEAHSEADAAIDAPSAGQQNTEAGQPLEQPPTPADGAMPALPSQPNATATTTASSGNSAQDTAAQPLAQSHPRVRLPPVELASDSNADHAAAGPGQTSGLGPSMLSPTLRPPARAAPATTRPAAYLPQTPNKVEFVPLPSVLLSGAGCSGRTAAAANVATPQGTLLPSSATATTTSAGPTSPTQPSMLAPSERFVSAEAPLAPAGADLVEGGHGQRDTPLSVSGTTSGVPGGNVCISYAAAAHIHTLPCMTVLSGLDASSAVLDGTGMQAWLGATPDLPASQPVAAAPGHRGATELTGQQLMPCEIIGIVAFARLSLRHTSALVIGLPSGGRRG